MIPFWCAITCWLFALSSGSLAVGLLSIAISIVFLRRQSVFVIAAVVAVYVSIGMHAHPEVRSVASEFKVVSATLEATSTSTTLTKVRVVSVEGCDACEGALGVYAGSLSEGDRTTGQFMLRPAFKYGVFVAKGHGVVTSAKPNAILSLRESFGASLAGVSSQSKALVAGLAIGDTSLFSKGFSDQLKVLSLTHLNAVSGANCAIVVVAVTYLLGFVFRKRLPRVLVAILALCGYVLLVGDSASVVRAAIMSAVVLLAIERGVWPIAALSLTVTVMICFDPNFAFDYGFALSVFATAGILVIAPNLAERFSKRMPTPLALALSVTIAAQLWCMPVLLSLQGGIPTYAVLANLLAEPVVAPITVLGIAAAVLSGLFPPIAALLSWLASIPAQWIVVVSRWLSAQPAATLSWHSGILGMLLLVVGLTVWLLRSARWGAAIMALVLVVESMFNGSALIRSASWLPTDWSIVNCNVGQGDGLVIRSGEHVAVVDVGREDGPIDSCLKELGVRNIELLVLTHFDADHIAGLAGLLKGRKVETVYLTPFNDSRPLVALTMQRIKSITNQFKVGLGVNGLLGEISFEVLSPSATGAECEDSNDCSLAMRWESKDWVLFTMADLGEKGQMRMASHFGNYLAHGSKPVVLKVAHHGSSDTFPELVEQMHPDVALVSVGSGNSYGHPTKRAMETLALLGSKVLRTDLDGAIAISGSLRFAVSGGG